MTRDLAISAGSELLESSSNVSGGIPIEISICRMSAHVTGGHEAESSLQSIKPQINSHKLCLRTWETIKEKIKNNCHTRRRREQDEDCLIYTNNRMMTRKGHFTWSRSECGKSRLKYHVWWNIISVKAPRCALTPTWRWNIELHYANHFSRRAARPAICDIQISIFFVCFSALKT